LWPVFAVCVMLAAVVAAEPVVPGVRVKAAYL
jgi:hypothetical protein